MSKSYNISDISNIYNPLLDTRATTLTKLKNTDFQVNIDQYKTELLDHIRNDQEMQELQKSDLMNKLNLCGKKYVHFICPNKHGKYSVSMKCNLSICPECATERYYKFLKKYNPILKKFKNPRFMTLTVPNVQILTNQDYKEFTKNWNKLMMYFKRYNKNKLKDIKNYSNEQIQFYDGIRVYETTYHKKTGYHLHMHILYDGSYISQSLLSRMWKKVTKTAMIVNISKVKSTRMKEVIKYIGCYMSKGNDIGYDQILQVYKASKKVKIIHRFGTQQTQLINEKYEICCPICKIKLEYTIKEQKIIIGQQLKPIYILKTTITQQQKKIVEQLYITDKITDIYEEIRKGIDDYDTICNKYGDTKIQKMIFEGDLYKKPQNKLGIIQ